MHQRPKTSVSSVGSSADKVGRFGLQETIQIESLVTLKLSANPRL